MPFRWDHHPGCWCGCGELADECVGRRDPLGSMRIRPPEPDRIRLADTAYEEAT